ncbi:unnamed protein product [Coffea canephora]|uniref:DH200=94 genomic scaffold, scaffold_189 n=1 Tax=Coffea canephora TaxID=49390 RepID=A0A068VB10_COFCA|nr:unnamed protein product [Coffea canephora]
MTNFEVRTSDNVVTGMFLVNSMPAYVLFDCGASHLFVIKRFTKHPYLVQINMSDFDVILGVDWFTRHYAYIDCRGKKAHLDYVVDVEKEEKLDKIPIVKNFLDVFPDDLPRLPLKREIEFEINIDPTVALYLRLSLGWLLLS